VRAAFAGVLLFLIGCLPARSCIEPPQLSTEDQRTIAVNLIAKFSAIPVSPGVDAQFGAIAKETFATLSDTNAAYLITLRAAECFSKDGKWGQAVAARMLLDLETEWKLRTGQQSLESHPQAPEVKAILQNVEGGK